MKENPLLQVRVDDQNGGDSFDSRGGAEGVPDGSGDGVDGLQGLAGSVRSLLQ